jgi:hypothetical protein
VQLSLVEVLSMVVCFASSGLTFHQLMIEEKANFDGK